jgi:hypothetical protein
VRGCERVGRGSEDPCTYKRIGGSGVRSVEEWGEEVRIPVPMKELEEVG